MESKIKNKVSEWLNKYFARQSTDSSVTIDEILKNENAIFFLFIWSIFEQKCFSGSFTIRKIEDFVCNNIEKFKVLDCDEAIKHFHKRYQNSDKYENLKHRDDVLNIDSIKNKAYDSLSPEDKFNLLLYVIYRFRNNIFHGNKHLENWGKFDEQIGYCLTSMISIIDVY